VNLIEQEQSKNKFTILDLTPLQPGLKSSLWFITQSIDLDVIILRAIWAVFIFCALDDEGKRSLKLINCGSLKNCDEF
jgi:hypothetical protein